MLSDRVLVERLKELEAEGIITKAVRCGEGNRLEYFLTEKGEDLQLAMEQIQHWAEKWVKDERMQLTASKTSCKLNVIK